MDIFKKLKISVDNLEKLRKNTITITKKEAIEILDKHNNTKGSLKTAQQQRTVEVVRTVERRKPRDRDGGSF